MGCVKRQKKATFDYFPFERPGESLYEKESREAEAILAKQQAARKASTKLRKPRKS
jgi:hypothetical protein